MNIINKIKVIFKERQYDNYLWKHKDNVREAFTEMVMCSDLAWLWEDNEELYDKMLIRIENHDNSKLTEAEYFPYREHFYPINEKEKNKSAEAFEKAWQHHIEFNDHHWQHRVNDTDFTIDTECAIIENVCDWLAMGYQFNDRPYEYYERNKEEISSKLPAKQVEFLEKIIYEGIDKRYIERG